MNRLNSPALQQALGDWLTEMRVIAGFSANTLTAYGRDVGQFLDFMTLHKGADLGISAIAQTGQADLRAWMAEARGRGLSAPSNALPPGLRTRPAQMPRRCCRPVRRVFSANCRAPCRSAGRPT
jgi:Phage integrase, N-terminal SAM-like domain